MYVILALLVLISCSEDNVATNGNLTLDLDGLEELGSDFVYEGWLIVNGSPVSTGTFSSVTFPQSFTVNIEGRSHLSFYFLRLSRSPLPSKDRFLLPLKLSLSGKGKGRRRKISGK